MAPRSARPGRPICWFHREDETTMKVKAKAGGAAGRCVKGPRRYASKNHASHPKVLERETKSVKLNGTTIVVGKLFDENKILND